jgi:outer membrane protein assembly factor BamB
VTDLTDDRTKEIVVVDVKGKVFVLRPNGTTVWTKELTSYTNAQPAVADFDADGRKELAVGLVSNGNLYLLDGNGTRQWKSTAPFDSSITWMTTGQADADKAIEVIPATTNGIVAAVDGASGEIEWRRDLGSLAAVYAFGDGDGDGEPEVYAVAKDGKLRSLNASDGTVEWTTTLTSADVQVTPPPSMGDVDEDGTPEIVAVTNGGRVSVVDPNSGEILATCEREGEIPIYTHPTVADTDGDGTAEIYVMYGDGRVVALAYRRQG